MSQRPNPHGVESGPATGQRKPSEPENLIAAPLFGVAKATGDRRNEGRSLRSSPRTGKPSTRRREAVDTACRQEEGLSGPVNIGFILNMQRKLYRWSRENPGRVYRGNDEMDGVHFYQEVTRPISGYTWLGTLLSDQP